MPDTATPNTLHEAAVSNSAYAASRDYDTALVDVDGLRCASDDGVKLELDGVDHTARPTWKLRETIAFYRDVLGLDLVHTISARGWGQSGHSDFLHFFFDAGKGATIAFFYYIGTDQPAKYEPEDHPFYNANHTAWGVPDTESLQLWKTTLEARGIVVSPYTKHEILESIYFRDPNGYPIEVTLRLRDTEVIDAADARLTLQAALEVEDEMRAGGDRLRDIDTVWRRKGKLVEELLSGSPTAGAA